jgi:hypothetical protein
MHEYAALADGTDRVKRSTGRKTCHNVTLTITNLTWIDLGSKPRQHDDILLNIRLTKGTGSRRIRWADNTARMTGDKWTQNVGLIS